MGLQIVQLLVIWISLSCLRLPWKGKEPLAEVADELNENKIFETISSFNLEMSKFAASEQGGSAAGDGNLLKSEIFTAQLKLKSLREAYQDPFDELFRHVQERE